MKQTSQKPTFSLTHKSPSTNTFNRGRRDGRHGQFLESYREGDNMTAYTDGYQEGEREAEEMQTA